MIFKHADDIWKEATEKRLKLCNQFLNDKREECALEIESAKDRGSYCINIDLHNRRIYKILKAELKNAGYKVSRLKGDSWCNQYFTISWDKRKKDML